MPRLKLTAVYEYDADPRNYPGAKSAKEMAEIDQEDNLHEILTYAYESLEFEEKDAAQITIEPATREIQ